MKLSQMQTGSASPTGGGCHLANGRGTVRADTDDSFEFLSFRTDLEVSQVVDDPQLERIERVTPVARDSMLSGHLSSNLDDHRDLVGVFGRDSNAIPLRCAHTSRSLIAGAEAQAAEQLAKPGRVAARAIL